MPQSALKLAIGFAVETVRETSPVVHCIAPRAATSFIADVLSAAGAQPVLTGTSAEALAAIPSADAVAIDLAALSIEGADGVLHAIGEAREQGLPWVLDVTRLGRAPVGTDRLRRLLELGPRVVRAADRQIDGWTLENPGGATVLLGHPDSVAADGSRVQVGSGPDLLGTVSGAMAAVTALTAAVSSCADPLEAALAGAAWVGLAAERAEGGAHGPASFRVALIDALATVRGDEIAEQVRLN